MSRWLIALALVTVAGTADAQVFKPRGKGTPPPAKKADPPKADPKKPDKADPKKTAAAAPKAGARKVTTKPPQKSRVARGKGRPDDLTPEPVKKGKKHSDDDDVKVTDDGDDDVKVSDD